MSYRKFKADYIFTGGELLDKNHVLITDENGVVKNIKQQKDAGDDIEIFEGIISPGFVNCHCHLELSHLKNAVKSETGLVDFLIKVISSRTAIQEVIDAAMLNADEEMYNNGIVAVGDICNTIDSINIKQKSKVYYHNFIEVLGFNEDSEARFQSYVNVYNTFCNAGFADRISIVPHAPYTVSNSMFNLINDFSKEKVISIHNQETLAEDELFKTKTGAFLKLYQHLNINIDFFKPYNKSSLRSYLSLLNKAAKILLIHNTFTTQKDLNFAAKQSKTANQEIFWCLCVNANLYIENKLPPVELFKKNNCKIVLGTDSYASNYSLNIFNEIKRLLQNFPSLKLTEMLKWATINGAKALGIENKFGSFKTGAKPGIICINNIINETISDASAVKRLF